MSESEPDDLPPVIDLRAAVRASIRQHFIDAGVGEQVDQSIYEKLIEITEPAVLVVSGYLIYGWDLSADGDSCVTIRQERDGTFTVIDEHHSELGREP